MYQPYQQPYQIPYQPQMQTAPTQMSQNTLLKVNGYEGAKAYQMPPNSVTALFDANEDVFYVKSSDAGGFSNISSYRFEPVDIIKPSSNVDYVTRKEFDELKEIVNGKQFIPKSKQSDGNVKSIQ